MDKGDKAQKAIDGAARRQQKSLDRVKKAYWTMRESDERVIRANDTLIKARTLLSVAGKSPRKREPDPGLAWGDRLIHGNPNPKRRADD